MKKPERREWQPLEQTVPEALFRAEVEAWARRLGVQPREVRLQPMKRKWASCSGRGRITFNTELLYQSAAFRAEVIVHELLHLTPVPGPATGLARWRLEEPGRSC
jgi:predicted metal-dependent hydrolase